MTLGEGPPREKARRGSWILALLAAVSLVVFFADEVRQELVEGPTLWIAAEQTRGLTVGSPVWLAGHRVGRVAGIQLRPAAEHERPVVVRAVIREADADRLRADAGAVFQPPRLMEPTVVSLRPGSAGSPPWDYSDTLRARNSVTTAELRQRIDGARAALDSLRRAERRVLELAASGGGTVARLRRDGALRRRLRRQIGQVTRLSTLARSDSSDLGRLAGDPAAVARLSASVASADSLADRLARVAGQWSTLDRRLAPLQQRTARLRTLLGEARGSAGRLLYDDALRRELEELRAGVRAARAALLSDPFAWLRFRLF